MTSSSREIISKAMEIMEKLRNGEVVQTNDGPRQAQSSLDTFNKADAVITKAQELLSKMDIGCPAGQHKHDKGPSYARMCHSTEIVHREGVVDSTGSTSSSRVTSLSGSSTSFCERCRGLIISKNEVPTNLGMVVFDMDGTLTQENAFLWLYQVAEMDATNDQTWQAYLSGQVPSYEEVLAPLAENLRARGVTEHYLDSLFSGATITPGLASAIQTFQNAGVKCVVASCGSDALLKRINRELESINGRGFDDAMAVRMEYDDNGILVAMSPDVEYRDKGEAVRALQEKYGVPPEQCMAVGDSIGDVSMFKACKLGVLYNCTDENTARFIRENLSNVIQLHRHEFEKLPAVACKYMCR